MAGRGRWRILIVFKALCDIQKIPAVLFLSCPSGEKIDYANLLVLKLFWAHGVLQELSNLFLSKGSFFMCNNQLKKEKGTAVLKNSHIPCMVPVQLYRNQLMDWHTCNMMVVLFFWSWRPGTHTSMKQKRGSSALLWQNQEQKRIIPYCSHMWFLQCVDKKSPQEQLVVDTSDTNFISSTKINICCRSSSLFYWLILSQVGWLFALLKWGFMLPWAVEDAYWVKDEASNARLVYFSFFFFSFRSL